MKKAKPRSWYIQMIHIAKSKLHMDDDSYRANLVELTGKSSCKDMGIPELVQVLDQMQKLGFKIQPKKGASPKTSYKEGKTRLDKLRQVWISMAHMGVLRDGSDQALANWAKPIARNMMKKEIDKLEWLPAGVSDSLINTLKQWHKRELLKAIPSLLAEVRTDELGIDHGFWLEVRRESHQLEKLGQARLEEIYQWLEKVPPIYIGEQ